MGIPFRHLVSLVLIGGSAACSMGDAPTLNEPPELPQPPVVTSSGGVFVKTMTRGHAIDGDGYVVIVQIGTRPSLYRVAIGVNDSVLIKHADAGWAERWSVRLTGAATNCWQALPVSHDLAQSVDRVARIEFVIDCVPDDAFVVYDRVTPHSGNALDYHSTLSERYVLRGNQFRLQYTSGLFGSFEYLGYFGQSATGGMLMYWNNSAEPSSTARLRGDSLIVEYDDFMLHSDFEPGVFVKRSAESGAQ